MNKNMYDIEQGIMNCWNIVEDIKLLEYMVMEKDPSRDHIANYLLGLHTIYGEKFDQLFHTYEEVLRQQHEAAQVLKE